MNPTWEPQIGERLGPYQLIELLAVGGMGVVYRAHDSHLNRDVALKLLAPSFAATAEFARQFLAEARTLASLSHPHIVQIHGYGEERGVPYFAMELVEGENLHGLLQKTPRLNLTEALQIVRQGALGLQHAQQRGIIHGDIKPANLVLTNQGILKVADFGLAKRGPTAPAPDFGTPEYVSPETAAGQPTDHRSDIYSLGATLFHLLAGRPPFIGQTPTDVLNRQRLSMAPPASMFNALVPAALDKLVLRCLAKEPRYRFQSYAELIAELDRCLAELAAAQVLRPAGPLRRSLPALAVLALLANAAVLWQRSRPAEPVAPSARESTVFDATGSDTNPPTSAVPATSPSPAVVAAPHPPVIGPDQENAAAQFAQHLQQQAEPLLASGKLLEAWIVYQQWPRQPAHTQTKAQQRVAAQKDRIQQLARESWDKTTAELADLRQADKHIEALVLCGQVAKLLSLIEPTIAHLAQQERDRILADQDAYRQELVAQREAAAQAAAAELKHLRQATTQQVVARQWELARTELLAKAKTAEPGLRSGIEELLQTELAPLLELRQKILERAKAQVTPSIKLATRTGQVEGRVLIGDDGQLALGHILPQGVVSTPIAWDELPSSSVLHFYGACLDPASQQEQFAFAVLHHHFALAGLASVEQARRSLQQAGQTNPERAPWITSALQRLEDYEHRLRQQTEQRATQLAREKQAELAWRRLETALAARDPETCLRQLALFQAAHLDSEIARSRQSELDRLQASLAPTNPPAKAVALPLIGRGPAFRRILAKADAEAAEPLEKTGNLSRSLALDGFFQQRNLPLFGLPDDGQIIVRLGQWRIPLTVPVNGANALVLRAPRRVSHTFGTGNQMGQALVFLCAASGGSAPLEVRPVYGEESGRAQLSRVPNWLEPTVANELNSGVPVHATDGRRAELLARMIPLDPTRPLTQVTFSFGLNQVSPEVSVAVLAVALLPAPPPATTDPTGQEQAGPAAGTGSVVD